MHKNPYRLARLPVVTRAKLALTPRTRPAVIHQPRIQPLDYAAFRHILGDALPATFGTWLHVRRETGMQAVNDGHDVADVDVHPDEFARFCLTRRQRPTLRDLWRFAHGAAGGPAGHCRAATATMAPSNAATAGRGCCL